MEKKEVSVIYHADCPDGFGAAYAAWKKFGDTAQYFPVHHNTEPPLEIEGTEVYTLDYTYEAAQIDARKSRVKSWVIVDHHASKKETLPHGTSFVYDTEHSGAVLAWKYFHPDTPVPTLLNYIEDVDLWKFMLPDSSLLNAAVGLRDFDWGIWQELETLFETPEGKQQLITEGKVLRKKAEKTVKKLVENSAEEIEFEGYKVLAVNSPVHVSEIGNELAGMQPPFGIIWSRRGNKVIVSLRAKGEVDVSKLAAKYGGGGHPNAAAFSWEEENFLKLRNKKIKFACNL